MPALEAFPWMVEERRIPLRLDALGARNLRRGTASGFRSRAAQASSPAGSAYDRPASAASLPGPRARRLASRRWRSFAPEAWYELRLMVWPDRQRVTRAAAVVFAAVMLAMLFLMVVDLPLRWGMHVIHGQ